MKRHLTVLLAVVLAAGCATYRPPRHGRVFTKEYQGQGLYLGIQEITVTNTTDLLTVRMPVFNGYHRPVFLNVDEDVMFGNPAAPDVDCYDSRGEIILSGSLGRKVSYGCFGHAQEFVRIPAGHARDGQLVRMCTNHTSLRYEISLSSVVPAIDWLTPTKTETDEDGIVTEDYDTSPVPLPSATYKMVLDVPVRFSYLLEGSTRMHSADLKVKVTVYRED